MIRNPLVRESLSILFSTGRIRGFLFASMAKLACLCRFEEDFPYFVGGLYVSEEEKHDDTNGATEDGCRRKHARVR